MKRTSIAIATALGTILGLAFAGVAIATDPPAFDDVDADKDGKITKAEAAKVQGLDFAAADVDENGVLTRAEYEAAIG